MRSLRVLVARLRSRDLGAVELLETTLAEIERRAADVNAFAHVLSDRALAAARSADTRRGRLPPLHGVPFSVKEQIHVAGSRPVTPPCFSSRSSLRRTRR